MSERSDHDKVMERADKHITERGPDFTFRKYSRRSDGNPFSQQPTWDHESCRAFIQNGRDDREAELQPVIDGLNSQLKDTTADALGGLFALRAIRELPPIE